MQCSSDDSVYQKILATMLNLVESKIQSLKNLLVEVTFAPGRIYHRQVLLVFHIQYLWHEMTVCLKIRIISYSTGQLKDVKKGGCRKDNRESRFVEQEEKTNNNMEGQSQGECVRGVKMVECMALSKGRNIWRMHGLLGRIVVDGIMDKNRYYQVKMLFQDVFLPDRYQNQLSIA